MRDLRPAHLLDLTSGVIGIGFFGDDDSVRTCREATADRHDAQTRFRATSAITTIARTEVALEQKHGQRIFTKRGGRGAAARANADRSLCRQPVRAVRHMDHSPFLQTRHIDFMRIDKRHILIERCEDDDIIDRLRI